jgi:hypothetical protein
LKQKKISDAVLDFRRILIINPLYCNVAEKLLSLDKYIEHKLFKELKETILNNRRKNNCISL